MGGVKTVNMLGKMAKFLFIRNYGWMSKLVRRKNTYFLSINKAVAVGSRLQTGSVLYSYLAEDDTNRPIIITYLDGEPRHETQLEMVSQTGFVEKENLSKEPSSKGL